jgi:hypothetical protein
MGRQQQFIDRWVDNKSCRLYITFPATIHLKNGRADVRLRLNLTSFAPCEAWHVVPQQD